MCRTPPPFDPTDQKQRFETFHGQHSEKYSDVDLSSAGFYVIQHSTVCCLSCNKKHEIEEFTTSHPIDLEWHEETCDHVRTERVQEEVIRETIEEREEEAGSPEVPEVRVSEAPMPSEASSESNDDKVTKRSSTGTLFVPGPVPKKTKKTAQKQGEMPEWAKKIAASTGVELQEDLKFDETKLKSAGSSDEEESQSQSGPAVSTNNSSSLNTDHGDPPTQLSTYIQPGNRKSEAYRLSTFQNFWGDPNVDSMILAKRGFFYTGFHNQTKCFACGRTVENWEKDDNPADLKYHEPTCPLGKEEESENIPILTLLQSTKPNSSSPTSPPSQPANQAEEGHEQTNPNYSQIRVDIQNGPGNEKKSPVNLGNNPRLPILNQWRMARVISAAHKKHLTTLFLKRELDRLASFARWPTQKPNIDPMYLAKSGFFYLGDLDRTQCFSCGGVLLNWRLGDDAFVEHCKHFPMCRMVHGNETRNIPIQEHQETAEEKETKYPCNLPANPHMWSESKRLETFDRRWPSAIAATPAQIAKAGFFFLGERDRAKCWYCNGGVQSWEHDDDPWVEHAKWFPNCQFLLRFKGQHFVYHILKSNAYLARPIIASQTVLASPSPPKLLEYQDMPPTPSPTIIDPREEMRKRETRVKEIVKCCEAVKLVLMMGFDENVVAAILEDQILTDNEAYLNRICENVSEFLDVVLVKTEEVEKKKRKRERAMSRRVSHCLYVKDSEGRKYLVDTGADVSLLPATPEQLRSPPTGPKLRAANQTEIHTYGSQIVILSASNGEAYQFQFTIAKVDQALIGADFLNHFNLGVEIASSRLHDKKRDSYIRAFKLSDLQALEQSAGDSLELMCKVCFATKADQVFLPCGHLVCCKDCGAVAHNCPQCRRRISSKVQVFRS